jgi:hypothetical protein
MASTSLCTALLVSLVCSAKVALGFFVQLDVAATNAKKPTLPAWAERRLSQQDVKSRFELTHQLSPAFLLGDFNRDGQQDVAILARHKGTRKLGILILHNGEHRIHPLGCGIAVGNGGDNFDWMDFWRLGKSRATKGDALYVGREGSASGLIYWNGGEIHLGANGGLMRWRTVRAR